MEAPEFLVGGYFGHTADAKFSPEKGHFHQKETDNNGGNNQFTIDDLLDFSNDDEVMTDAFIGNVTGRGSSDDSTITVVDRCNSSLSSDIGCRKFVDEQLSGSELCVPYDDLAELEWLSNLVEDSFSSDDLQNLQLITATKTPTDTSSSDTTAATTIIAAANRKYQHFSSSNHNSYSTNFPSDVSVPGKARSKRSRAAPCDWSSRLLPLSAATSSSDPNNMGSGKANKMTALKKRENAETPGRRCFHCGSDKTPQWRTGPMGPKTLCNACGVRFKSGRLVPEYRPAASPTFLPTKHSNSHRKVLELRRQNELQRTQLRQPFLIQAQASSFLGVSSNGVDDYLMRHHFGPDFRHVI